MIYAIPVEVFRITGVVYVSLKEYLIKFKQFHCYKSILADAAHMKRGNDPQNCIQIT